MLKNQKGITLVALVVTIVVLIILATISIQIALNSGLSEKANTAKSTYQDAERLEQEMIVNAEHYINEQLKDVNFNATAE